MFEFDAGKLRELCELREVLETGALRVGLARGRRPLIDRLAAEVDLAAKSDLGDAPGYQPFDTAFHEALVRCSGNAELIEAYERISGRIRTIRYRLTRSRLQIAGSQQDHAEIVHLLQSGGDEAAQRCLAAHVYNGYGIYLRELDAEQNAVRGKRRATKGS